MSSLSLSVLLLEGHNELPGFNILGEADLHWEELLHLRRGVQAFALHVTHQCVFQAFKRQNVHFKLSTSHLKNTHTHT